MPACPSCGSHNNYYQSSSVCCADCGAVLEESQIVSDVTFGENSAGGAVVQGSYVSAAQSHVRSSNPRFRSGGAGESREQTMGRAREAIQRMGRANRVSPATCEKALRWFNLALDGVPEAPLANGLPQPKNYILGRKQEYTIAACLYVACRYAKTSHLLIDFAEAIDINVFSLGRHYLKLIAALNVKLPVIDPSFYILRFASLLDFGEETNKVAQDATRLCARFKKDWLGDGRRPAGICGAALLLAARMNNFQRSMNEIVQVVKMADVTIRERLEEFKRTPSGSLSIQDFKEIWLEEEHEPPAFYRPRLEEQRKKLKAEALVSGTAQSSVGKHKQGYSPTTKSYPDGTKDTDLAARQSGSLTPSDCDAEPALANGREDLTEELDAIVDEATRQEIDQYTQDETFQRMAEEAERHNLASQVRARMGTKAIMMATSKPVIAAAENLQVVLDKTGTERSSDAAIASNLKGSFEYPAHLSLSDSGNFGQQPAPVQSHSTEVQEGCPEEGHALAARDVSEAPISALSTSTDLVAGPSRSSILERSDCSSSTQPSKSRHTELNSSHFGPLDTLSDLDEDELDQFILGEEEVRIKERIWMEFNYDYMQDALQRRLKEEADVKAGILKKRGPRKNASNKGLARDSRNATASTAEEATKEMLLRKKTSRKLNYGAIENLFGSRTGASGYRDSLHRRRGKGRKRRKGDGESSESDVGDEAIRQAWEAGLDVSGLEVLDEPGDALPTTHPLHRKESRTERANKEKRKHQKIDKMAGRQSGDESGGQDVGEPLTDGATTDGEEAGDLSWNQYRQGHYSFEGGADGDESEFGGGADGYELV